MVWYTTQEPECEKSRQSGPRRTRADSSRLCKDRAISWGPSTSSENTQAGKALNDTRTAEQIKVWLYWCGKRSYHWEWRKKNQNWSGGPGNMADNRPVVFHGVGFKYQKARVKGTHHLISRAKLSVVSQLFFVQAGRHFNNIVGLKLYDLKQRSKHAFWNDLQNLQWKGKAEKQLKIAFIFLADKC